MRAEAGAAAVGKGLARPEPAARGSASAAHPPRWAQSQADRQISCPPRCLPGRLLSSTPHPSVLLPSSPRPAAGPASVARSAACSGLLGKGSSVSVQQKPKSSRNGLWGSSSCRGDCKRVSAEKKNDLPPRELPRNPVLLGLLLGAAFSFACICLRSKSPFPESALPFSPFLSELPLPHPGGPDCTAEAEARDVEGGRFLGCPCPGAPASPSTPPTPSPATCPLPYRTLPPSHRSGRCHFGRGHPAARHSPSSSEPHTRCPKLQCG